MLPIPNPTAFTLFGLEIRWYAITMVTGILLAFIFVMYRLKRFGIDQDSFLDFFLFLIPISIIGARLYYVAFEWHYYRYHIWEIFNIRSGGLAIHGALLFGLLVCVFYCRIKKYNLLKFLDLLIPAVSLGQAIGRWGNYFNMEAHGRITKVPWAIPIYDLAGEVIHVHPTFLYESIGDLALFIFLVIFENKYEKKCGQATFLYMIFYSILRFFVEGLRTDSLIFLGLRQAQLISIAFIIIGIIGLIYVQKKGKPFKLLTEKDVNAEKVS